MLWYFNGYGLVTLKLNFDDCFMLVCNSPYILKLDSNASFFLIGYMGYRDWSEVSMDGFYAFFKVAIKKLARVGKTLI